MFLLKKERIPGSALTKCHQFNRSWFFLSTEGRTGERRPIQTACLGFLYSVPEESFETNPKGLKEKKRMLENVSFCSISMLVSHVMEIEEVFFRKDTATAPVTQGTTTLMFLRNQEL